MPEARRPNRAARITILRIGQRISVHLFVGLRLLGPVAIHFNRYVARPGGRWIALADGLAGGLVLAIV
jgi:hypothetical protein